MRSQAELERLQSVLTSFLERAVAGKAERLAVLSGINRLDDVARRLPHAGEAADELGNWMAQYHFWLRDPDNLRYADRNRLQSILGVIRKELAVRDDSSPAAEKLHQQIDRWQAGITESQASGTRSLTLRRPAERSSVAPVASPVGGTEAFAEALQRVIELFRSQEPGRAHLLSILDDTLKKAELQQHPDSLLLAATMIYYLQRSGYLVGPYLARLKAAEQLQRKGGHATPR